MKIPKYIINKAKEVALTSNVRRGKLAAIIFSARGNIEAFAPNTVVMGKEKERRTFTIHAEEFVLAKAIRTNVFRHNNVADLVLLVLRVRPSTMELCNARPCKKCQKLLQESSIRTYYTDKNGEIRRFQ